MDAFLQDLQIADKPAPQSNYPRHGTDTQRSWQADVRWQDVVDVQIT